MYMDRVSELRAHYTIQNVKFSIRINVDTIHTAYLYFPFAVWSLLLFKHFPLEFFLQDFFFFVLHFPFEFLLQDFFFFDFFVSLQFPFDFSQYFFLSEYCLSKSALFSFNLFLGLAVNKSSFVRPVDINYLWHCFR